MNDLVSVVIPVYNGERYIGSTLQSVLVQSHSRLEILVVDDGSTDRTAEILRRYCKDDPRIRVFQQTNRGVAAARNLGIRSAQGDFIAPLDADDIWHPERISKQLHCMLDAPSDVGLVYSSWISIDEFGAGRSECVARDGFEGVVWLQLMIGNFLGCASTALIRTACLRAVGLYDEGYFSEHAQGCEDWDLYLRIAKQFRFRYQPECLIGYRQVSGSMSVDVDQMMRSYERCMSRSGCAGRSELNSIYRWSRANFLLYMAERPAAGGCLNRTTRLLLRVLASDPVRALDPRVGRTLARCLLSRFRKTRQKIDLTSTSASDLWRDLPKASARRVPKTRLLWNKVRRSRERAIARLQQRLEWPVRLDAEPPENTGAQG